MRKTSWYTSSYRGTRILGFGAASWSSNRQSFLICGASPRPARNKFLWMPPSPRSLNESWPSCILHLPLPQSRQLCLMDRVQRWMRWQRQRPSNRHSLNGRRGSKMWSNLHHHHLWSSLPCVAPPTNQKIHASLTRRIWFCAGCSKHGHARHACSSVTVQSIATAGAPALGEARVPHHYPEDVSSNDNFFTNLEVHPKVTPLLKVRIHHAKGWFVYPSFPDSVSAISLASSELASRFGVEVSKMLASLPQLTTVNGDPLRVNGVGPFADWHTALRQLHPVHRCCFSQCERGPPSWLPFYINFNIIFNQPVKFKEVKFEENLNQFTSYIQALILTTK